MNMLSFSISWASGLIPHDLVTWILGRDLMASDAELVERTIEVSGGKYFKGTVNRKKVFKTMTWGIIGFGLL
jgi:hypothetical protein